MARKALYHDGVFIRYINEATAPAKPAVVEVLPVSVDDTPTPTDAEKVVTDTIIEDGIHRIRKQLVSKDQAELDADAVRVLNAQERETAKAYYAALKDGSATVQNVKDVLAFILKDLYQ